MDTPCAAADPWFAADASGANTAPARQTAPGRHKSTAARVKFLDDFIATAFREAWQGEKERTPHFVGRVVPPCGAIRARQLLGVR